MRACGGQCAAVSAPQHRSAHGLRRSVGLTWRLGLRTLAARRRAAPVTQQRRQQRRRRCDRAARAGVVGCDGSPGRGCPGARVWLTCGGAQARGRNAIGSADLAGPVLVCAEAAAPKPPAAPPAPGACAARACDGGGWQRRVARCEGCCCAAAAVQRALHACLTALFVCWCSAARTARRGPIGSSTRISASSRGGGAGGGRSRRSSTSSSSSSSTCCCGRPGGQAPA